MKEIIEIQETYNKEGYLIKITTNDIPFFVPKQDFPQVQINMSEVEWITEKFFMTKQEFENLYPPNLE